MTGTTDGSLYKGLPSFMADFFGFMLVINFTWILPKWWIRRRKEKRSVRGRICLELFSCQTLEVSMLCLFWQVWYRVIQIVINRDDVQGYAAKTVFEVNLSAPSSQICAWIVNLTTVGTCWWKWPVHLQGSRLHRTCFVQWREDVKTENTLF